MKEVVKVLHLETGEERLINLSRFNPELHQKLEEPFLMGDGVADEVKPLPEEPKDEPKAKPIDIEVPNHEDKPAEETPVKEPIDEEVEKVENEVEIDLSNVSEDKVKDLSWNQLRALAKSMEILSGGVSRELLQAQVIEKLSNK